MSEWVNINIDTEGLREERELEDGVRVIVSPSPYDVPGAIKAEFDRSKGQLRILFRYIGTEPVKRQSGQAGVLFGMGKNSGRLYEIDVKIDEADMRELTANELTARISHEIDHVPKVSSYGERKENYRLAKQALEIAEIPISSALGLVPLHKLA
ncbi:MAG TPA: hypothetical protein VGJ48_00720 [Pyrinomonadaceae bacterium]|jgi:hypothetical protein